MGPRPINLIEVKSSSGKYVACSKDMYAKATVNGISTNCLIDSGSACSGINVELFGQLSAEGMLDSKLLSAEARAFVLNGNREECFGHINLSVEIGPSKFEANFWVFDMNPKLLVGRDLISKHIIVIDVSNARIMIGSLEIALMETNPTNLAWAGEEGRQTRLEWIRQIRAKM